jgi:hypothetical protein
MILTTEGKWWCSYLIKKDVEILEVLIESRRYSNIKYIRNSSNTDSSTSSLRNVCAWYERIIGDLTVRVFHIKVSNRI